MRVREAIFIRVKISHDPSQRYERKLIHWSDPSQKYNRKQTIDGVTHPKNVKGNWYIEVTPLKNAKRKLLNWNDPSPKHKRKLIQRNNWSPKYQKETDTVKWPIPQNTKGNCYTEVAHPKNTKRNWSTEEGDIGTDYHNSKDNLKRSTEKYERILYDYLDEAGTIEIKWWP